MNPSITKSSPDAELAFYKAIIAAIESKEPQIVANACIAHGKKHAWIKVKTSQNKVAFYLFQEYGAVCVDLYIGGFGNREANQMVFDQLHSQKTRIENQFDRPVSWVRNHPNSSRACRIIVRNADRTGLDFNVDQAVAWGADNLIKLYKTLMPLLSEILHLNGDAKAH
jgi:hypothetical protein